MLTRRVLILLLITAVCASAPEAFAQDAAAPSPPASTSTASSPPTPALKLSMDQAVAMALDENLGLKADRLDVAIAAENVAGARAAFHPLLESGFQRRTSTQPPTSFVQGNGVVSSNSAGFGSTISQNLPWMGGRYSAEWQASRNTTTALSSFNPQLGSTLSLNFTQPLLRGFRTDDNRVAVQSAERQRTIADLALEGQVAATTNAVQAAYLALIGDIQGLDVAQQNMALAQQQLQNSRSRVAVGVGAEIDTIQAQAAVASNEEQVIVAQASIATAEDALRALILNPDRPDYWQVHLEPTDTIQATPTTVDEAATIQTALDQRVDLLEAKRHLEITSLNRGLDDNLTRPDVSLSVNYTAQGTGGTQFTFGAGFPPPVTSQTTRRFGQVVNDALVGTYPSWTTGLTFSYPLGHSAAKARQAEARLREQQERLSLRTLEQQIATEVRSAVRDVETNYKRVQATQAARVANERQYTAEQRRFEVGLSDIFTVLQKQSLLAQAKVTELNAMLAYNNALIRLQRVQKIP